MLHPITFSIPAEKITTTIPPKEKILSNLIPGIASTYIYNTEADYYNEYKKSYFAITTKKGGWDCMRHYEIMANGCIPYFPDIEHCPINTMALLPKTLLLEGNALYNKFKTKTIHTLTADDKMDDLINAYTLLQTKFLDYTKNHLTTTKMANYILEKSNHTSASKILYLSGDLNPDYLRCVTLHGFKELLGANCHDYPKVPHIYKSSTINYKNLYGKGITYTNLLDSELHNTDLDHRIVSDIQNKYYDIIIYGSYHRGMPLYDLVKQMYKPHEIILLCGEDIHQCDYTKWLEQGHHVFVREL
jgi:hypothetical protein